MRLERGEGSVRGLKIVNVMILIGWPEMKDEKRGSVDKSVKVIRIWIVFSNTNKYSDLPLDNGKGIG